MQDKLVSVIVPIYNVEAYLERCLDSILTQTYENLEIILVNDGSPDNCGRICNEYKKRDARIKVIHRENGGLSAARNSGLDIASGMYVGFVDPDDWIEPNMYEHMMSVMVETGSDIVQCGVFVHEDVAKPLEKNSTTKASLYSYNDFNSMLEARIMNHITPGQPLTLYKAKIWCDLRLAKGFYHQDDIIFPEIMSKCSILTKTSAKLYHYLKRSDSIKNKEKTLAHLKSREKIVDVYYQVYKEKLGAKVPAAYAVCKTINEERWYRLATKSAQISMSDLKSSYRATIKAYRTCYCDAQQCEKYRKLSKKTHLYWFIYYISPSLALLIAKIVWFWEKN